MGYNKCSKVHLYICMHQIFTISVPGLDQSLFLGRSFEIKIEGGFQICAALGGDLVASGGEAVGRVCP